MPQIIVTADRPSTDGERVVMFTERVSVSDFQSDHFQAQLVERLGWAVGDAHAVEDRSLELEAGAEAAAQTQAVVEPAAERRQLVRA